MDLLSKGWECPKCGAVMSPMTHSCINCTGNLKPQNKIKKMFSYQDIKNMTREEVVENLENIMRSL